LLEGKEIALSVLFLENVIEQRRRLKKKPENGTRLTRVLMSNSWCGKRDGEENAGTHRRTLTMFPYFILIALFFFIELLLRRWRKVARHETFNAVIAYLALWLVVFLGTHHHTFF